MVNYFFLCYFYCLMGFFVDEPKYSSINVSLYFNFAIKFHSIIDQFPNEFELVFKLN
jgi:hypothetical protein